MPVESTRNRIKANIWKAIAQSDLNIDALPKSELDDLVELVTEAAMIEMDQEMNSAMKADKTVASQFYSQDEQDDEQVLWEGRPFLSITEHYTITNERIRIVRGVLGKDKQDIELLRVQDIDQKQTIRERLLNLGDIIVSSHDSATPRIVLNNVKDSEKVHQLLRRAVLDVRKRHNLTFQEEM